MPEIISVKSPSKYGTKTYLSHGVLEAADGQDPLYGTPRIIADGALGAGQPANLGNILTCLSDHCGGLRAGDNRANVNPVRLVLGGVLVRLGASSFTVRCGRLDRLSLGVILAIGCIGDDCVTLGVLRALNSGDLVARHVRLGLGVAAHYFVQGGSLGLGLIVGGRRRRRVLERTLGRLKVGRRGRHDAGYNVLYCICLHLRESRVSRMKLFSSFMDRLFTPEVPTENVLVLVLAIGEGDRV